ncbi:MAG: glycosyltransferase family 4 protein [candidate division WOR-3 bacterium]|nr:glycosyltransferase family 4 protein [candidate division WOR-3 bacterium]
MTYRPEDINPDKKKLKILLVSDMYYPLPGGIPEHIHNLYLVMKRKGHCVHILTGKSFTNKSHVSDDVKRFGHSISVPANKSFSQITMGVNMFGQIKSLLEKEQYDIVHIHGSLAPTLPILTLYLSRGTNIVTFHAAHNHSVGYSALQSPLSKLFRKIHGPIAVSKEAERSIEKYFPANYRIIPNGVDVERFSHKNRILEKFNDNKINLLFVGRHDPRKGIKYLYKAMDYVIKKHRNVRLIVVGKGFLKRYYKLSISEESRDYIEFQDYVDYDLLPLYYRTADIFISPATGGESFGIVLLESMASGTPIVASRIRGYRQVAKHRYNAFFVKPEDPVELAEGINELIENEQLRKDLISNGLKHVQRYSWENVTQEVLDYYREIMGNRKNNLMRGIISNG